MKNFIMEGNIFITFYEENIFKSSAILFKIDKYIVKTVDVEKIMIKTIDMLNRFLNTVDKIERKYEEIKKTIEMIKILKNNIFIEKKFRFKFTNEDIKIAIKIIEEIGLENTINDKEKMILKTISYMVRKNIK